MSDERHFYVVSVGSNIEPMRHIDECRALLREEIEFLGESEFFQTKPDGYQDQPDFMNGAFYLASPLAHDAFKAYLKSVEQRLGRVKGAIKSGPRTMDLDIVICDGQVVHEDYRVKDYIRVPVDQILAQQQIRLR